MQFENRPSSSSRESAGTMQAFELLLARPIGSTATSTIASRSHVAASVQDAKIDQHDSWCDPDSNDIERQKAGRGRPRLPAELDQSVWRPPRWRTNNKTTKLIPMFGCLLLFLEALLSGVGCVVVYQVRFIASRTGRTDYALAGESIELSCLHMMKDEAEDIKQLVWSKDGKNFLRWRKNKPGLEVLSYTFKGHVDPSSSHSHLIIHNATIEMHGKYRCAVRTDLSQHEGELDLVVISASQCGSSEWRVSSEQTRCRELFRLDCRQMFPRPVSSCGLWNSKLDKFIRSVTLDVSEEQLSSANGTQTYRVKYVEKFDLVLPNGSLNPLHKELLHYAGHLIFKCDIVVPDTSWRLSVAHKMFDFSDGCNQDPLEAVERMRANFGQYARHRLQQLYRKSKHQFDDIEMLASNLNYELLPPASASSARESVAPPFGDSKYQTIGSLGHNRTMRKSQQQQQQQQHQQPASNWLNCWQKPRVGSRARLSCVPSPFQPDSQGGQLKLSGTNMLECRTSGWVPIDPAADKTNGKARLAPRSRFARKLRLNRTASVVSFNSDQAGQQLDESEESEPDDDHKPELRAPSSVSTLLTASSEQDEQHNQIDTMADVSPRELAALLPTCILITNNPARQRLDGRQHGRPADENGTRPLRVHEHALTDTWLKRFTSISSSASRRSAERSQAYLLIVVTLATLRLVLAAMRASNSLLDGR